jgi:hypothetical protein
MANQDYNKLCLQGGIPVLPNVPIAFTQGNIWHVKPSSGLDGNDGTSPDKALKTLKSTYTRYSKSE